MPDAPTAEREGPLTIRVDEPLDIGVARKVAERMAEARADLEIRIEIAPGIRCDLVALSHIAEAVERRSAPVRVHGLSGHDTRILRYLGVVMPGARERSSTE